ncbi:MAG: alpha/beta hydrolase [Pseudomonadota bacterium]
MTKEITEHVAKTERHRSFYLGCGPDAETPVIFCHGWPELAQTWRRQLQALGAKGVRTVAPDMRGYGRSSIHPSKDDYRIEEIVRDMIELLDHLDTAKAIWVGHDLGAPVVWSIAQHFPERCAGVVGVCVPYMPMGLTLEALVDTVDREIYPKDQYLNGQWDYIAFYQDNFDLATKAFDADPTSTVHALFRSGDASGVGRPAFTATTRERGGWFGPNGAPAPRFPLDTAVLSEDEAQVYIDALTRNGFTAPDSWYMNLEANAMYADKAKASWRLEMPVLFVHAAYDVVCATDNPKLTAAMREHCPDLTEATIPSGHWVAQEQPEALNSILTDWLQATFPATFS